MLAVIRSAGDHHPRNLHLLVRQHRPAFADALERARGGGQGHGRLGGIKMEDSSLQSMKDAGVDPPVPPAQGYNLGCLNCTHRKLLVRPDRLLAASASPTSGVARRRI
jgi:hypothetical protein